MTRAVLRALVVSALVLASSVSPLRAQDGAEPLLARAVAMLDATQPERAAELLRRLLAGLPATAPLTIRREAHLGLATASWSLGLLDSAAVHFQAAVSVDAFLQLDPETFNPDLVAAFRTARRAMVAVGVRAPRDTLLDPHTGRWRVAVAVTQPGQVRLHVVRSGGRGMEPRPVTLAVDSSATVTFPATVADSATLTPGTYRLVAEFSGATGTAADSGVSLEVAQSTPDTLAHEPPPPDSMYRLELRWGPRSRGPLLRSVGVGVGAAAIPLLMGNTRLRTWGTQSRALLIGASVSIAGLAGYFLGRPKLLLPENIAYNRALRSTWEERNRVIVTANAARRGTPMLRVRVVVGP